MIEKVYIGDLDDLEYEIKTTYPKSDIEIISTLDITEDGLIKLHQPNLFSNKKCKVFITLEDYKLDFLLNLSDNITQKVIWTFKSLPSNTKLYKSLESKCKIIKLDKLTYLNNRRKFIEQLFNKYSIRSYPGLLDLVLLNSSESKLSIESEIKKLSVAQSIFNNIDISLLRKVICSYKAENDVFSFIDSLLEGQVDLAYFYLNKIHSSIHPNVLKVLLLKRLGYLLGVVWGNEKFSKSCMNIPPFLIQKNKALALRLGRSKLEAFYMYIDQNINTYATSSEHFKVLTSIIVFTATAGSTKHT